MFKTACLVQSDTVTAVKLTSPGAAAVPSKGGYDINAAAAEGTGLGNYDITYVDGKLTVAAKALTVTAEDREKTYGQALELGTTGFKTAGLVRGRHRDRR